MANIRYTDEQKFQALAKFECDEDNRIIAEALRIPYTTIARWRMEWKESKLNGSIQSLVNVDSMLIHRVAEELKYDLNILESIPKRSIESATIEQELENEVESVVIEHEAEQVTIEQKPKTESEVVAMVFKSSLPESVFANEVANMVDKIDSYQLLNTAMHSTALKLVSKISILSDKENTGPLELGTLVESLARIQVAFFNKNSTNVNILNQQVVSEREVATFKAFKKA